MGISLNTTSNNVHVPKIERYIQTVKECTRATINSSPFKCCPQRLSPYNSIFRLNSIPPGIAHHGTISPRTIDIAIKLDVRKHCKAEFGSDVQTHKYLTTLWLLEQLVLLLFVPQKMSREDSISTASVLDIGSTDTVGSLCQCLKL